MFEKAVRMKLRFPYNGMQSVEDLWDLKVQALDKIYRALRAEQKEIVDDTLLTTATTQNTTLQLKVDIVTHIVNTKLAEQAAATQTAENRAKRQKLEAILAAKQDAALHNMSEEDLQKAIGDLS